MKPGGASRRAAQERYGAFLSKRPLKAERAKPAPRRRRLCERRRRAKEWDEQLLELLPVRLAVELMDRVRIELVLVEPAAPADIQGRVRRSARVELDRRGHRIRAAAVDEMLQRQ